MQNMAAEMGEAADNVRVLAIRNKGEQIIEKAGNGRVWRPVLVVAVPTIPQAKTRSEKRGAGEWKEAKGSDLSSRAGAH